MVKIKLIEAYLRVQFLEDRINFLTKRLESNIPKSFKKDKDIIDFYKSTIYELEELYNEYQNLMVKLIKTLVLVEGKDNNSLLSMVLRLIVNSKKKDVLELMIENGDCLVEFNGSKSGLSFPALLERSKIAHNLIESLEDVVLKYFIDTDLL